MAGTVPGRARCRAVGPSRAHSNRPAPWALALGWDTFPTNVRHMYEELCSWNSLLEAYRRAAKGKRGKPCVAAFAYRLEENLWDLRKLLLSETYCPQPYVSFYVHDPKKRLISAAAFRDRVVHHALCMETEPPFERSFVSCSYANRSGKGTHKALEQCQQFSRAYPYVLQCDVRQFFPAVDHDILREAIARKVTDERVLRLVDLILASGVGVLAEEYEQVYFEGDDLLSGLRPRGLPIGNLTSQFWANVYLSSFDHFVKRELRCAAYIRYVDDFLLFAHEKAQLWEWHERIVRRLAALRLTIHPGSHPRPVREGIPFLGFVVYPDRRRVKGRNAVRFARRLREQMSQHARGVLPQQAVTASVQGWVNHVRYGNTVGLRKRVLGSVVIRPTGEVVREDET